jgi:hypothetical protein
MTEDQQRILAAYKIALSMMRDRTPRKLLDLLNVLECRDLLRKEAREEIDRRRVGLTKDLSDEWIEAIKNAEMSPEHDHLNALMDEQDA